MIELNLLPEDLRKKKKTRTVQMPEIPVIPIAAGVIALVTAAHFLLGLLVGYNDNLAKTLKKKWVSMEPQRKMTEVITRNINDLEKRTEAVKNIARPDLNWTRLLSGLNRAMIPGVWLNGMKITYNGKPYDINSASTDPGELIISGYALGKSEVATAIAARFLNSMKETVDFSGYFREIELKSLRTGSVAGEDVMTFSLTCYFEGPGGTDKGSESGKKAPKRSRKK